MERKRNMSGYRTLIRVCAIVRRSFMLIKYTSVFIERGNRMEKNQKIKVIDYENK
jgi:hypothetical protein